MPRQLFGSRFHRGIDAINPGIELFDQTLDRAPFAGGIGSLKDEDHRTSCSLGQPELKLDDISAFLNKTKDEKTAPQKPSDKTGSPKLAEADAQGNDQAVTATLINALTSKVKGCFNVPPAARDADISVRIHFLLNQDGSVNGQPEVASMNSDPIFDATARAAVSAILECQNYDLPPDQYELWKDNTLDFNPNLLFGT